MLGPDPSLSGGAIFNTAQCPQGEKKVFGSENKMTRPAAAPTTIIDTAGTPTSITDPAVTPTLATDTATEPENQRGLVSVVPAQKQKKCT